MHRQFGQLWAIPTEELAFFRRGDQIYRLGGAVGAMVAKAAEASGLVGAVVQRAHEPPGKRLPWPVSFISA